MVIVDCYSHNCNWIISFPLIPPFLPLIFLSHQNKTNSPHFIKIIQSHHWGRERRERREEFDLSINSSSIFCQSSSKKLNLLLMIKIVVLKCKYNKINMIKEMKEVTSLTISIISQLIIYFFLNQFYFVSSVMINSCFLVNQHNTTVIKIFVWIHLTIYLTYA